MAKKITIGEHVFPSKKAALEEIRAIRDRYADRASVSPSDHEFLLDLISLHNEASEKVGIGISHFTVATETEFGGRNRHFVLHRHDGTSTDFSFQHCLSSVSKERNDRMSALRQAIKEQTWAFRDGEFASGRKLVCPYEQTTITPRNCQIDHQAPWTFDSLVNEWLKAEGILLEGIEITPSTDNQLVGQMTNPTQIISWQNFHRSHAKLRLLSIRGNLSGARRRDP